MPPAYPFRGRRDSRWLTMRPTLADSRIAPNLESTIGNNAGQFSFDGFQ
jgi:hypothetical protein